LHGTMQQRLVMIEAELQSVARQLAATTDSSATAELVERLHVARAGIDALREQELRTLSTALYPEALDRGLIPAIRALTARIPPSIAVDFTTDGFAEPDGLSQEA